MWYPADTKELEKTMQEKRVRIRDIAEELGLSTATVSNVIHGKIKKLSDETVRRVQEKLEEREYIPSMAGILLAENSSRIVGVFVNDHEKYDGHTLEDAFIASSLNYLSNEIEAQGQFMMVKKAKNPREILTFASMWNMDGLVVIGFCRQDYQYLRNHMRIPFVVYDGFCEETERIVNLTLDNFSGGFQAGNLLKQKGHQRALCISDNDTGVDKERMDGFEKAFGKEAAERLIIPIGKAERLAYYRANWNKLRSSTAVFAVSDYYAIDLLFFLQENGISVPGEISLVGFDDIPLCQLISPALTTVRQDGALRARLAIEKLHALKEGEKTEAVLTLPVTLVERESVTERCKKRNW